MHARGKGIVIVGPGAQANAEVTINERTFGKWHVAVVTFVAVAVLGTLLVVRQRWNPAVATLQGLFAVAVAQFEAQDGARDSDALAVSDAIAATFTGSYTAGQNLWLPATTGPVATAGDAGDDELDRHMERIRANALIYGTVTPATGGFVQVRILLRIRDEGSMREGAERLFPIVGGSELTEPAFADPTSLSGGTGALAAPAQAALHVTLALNHLAGDNPDEADAQLRSATEQLTGSDVGSPSGLALIESLRGVAQLRAATVERTLARIPKARELFASALAYDPNEKLAAVGDLWARYLSALGEPRQGSWDPSGTDLAALAAVEKDTAALAADPGRSPVPWALSQLLVAQIQLVRAELEPDAAAQMRLRERAAGTARLVIDRNAAERRAALAVYAGAAFHLLAFIDARAGRPDGALGHYDAAAELGGSWWKAWYAAAGALVLADSGRCAEAQERIAVAIAAARSNGFSEARDRYARYEQTEVAACN